MITTVQQHILQQQQQISEASGRFSWLRGGITLATKMVEAKIHTAALSDVLDAFGNTNIQGQLRTGALKGGVFLNPPSKDKPGGKLRILDIKPTNIHQRTPFIVGSRREMEAFRDGEQK